MKLRNSQTLVLILVLIVNCNVALATFNLADLRHCNSSNQADCYPNNVRHLKPVLDPPKILPESCLAIWQSEVFKVCDASYVPKILHDFDPWLFI